MTVTDIPLGTYIGEAEGLATRMSNEDLLRLARRMSPGVVPNPPVAANREVQRRYEILLGDHADLQSRYDALVANLRGIMQWLPPEPSGG